MTSVKIFEEYIKYYDPEITSSGDGKFLFCLSRICEDCVLNDITCNIISMPSLSKTQLLKMQDKYPEKFI